MKEPAVVVRKVTDEAFAAQRVGALHVAPGIWIDRHGGVHVSVPDLLAMIALEDTPENRTIGAAIVADTLQELMRGQRLTIVQQDRVTS